MVNTPQSASRKEVLPAFLGVLVVTILLFAGMSALQPMLMGTAYICLLYTSYTMAMFWT